MNQSDIRLAVFSAQPLFCTGINLSLSKYDEIQVSIFGQLTDPGLDKLMRLLPDVIIIDLDEGIESSLETLRYIQRHLSGPSIIVMSSKETDASRVPSIKEAVHCPKSLTASELYTTIMSAATRQTDHRGMPPKADPMPALAKNARAFVIADSASDSANPLTAREREVLKYVALGYLNKQIADALGISTETIKNHVTSSLRKLNASCRTDAVVQALRKGLITIN